MKKRDAITKKRVAIIKQYGELRGKHHSSVANSLGFQSVQHAITEMGREAFFSIANKDAPSINSALKREGL